MVNIHNLIAAISPDIYCDSSVRNEVKSIVKKDGYLKAAEKAKPISSEVHFKYDDAKKNPLNKWGLKAPKEEHSITYDSAAESLEPVYFWLLDFLQGPFKKVEKITDNFVSSPGSGHFSELGQKATQMQQQATKVLGDVNTVIRSILGLLYDLKEFRIKLDPYDRLKSKDEIHKSSALLTLKQTWMDTVDIKRGQGSINALTAGQLDFATLRDAFMKVDSVKEVDTIDLNERVKRILKQRIGEFEFWINQSESSLRQRFEIEKNYLKSQVNSLKLYARWIKPYLNAAKQLEQQESSDAALVSAFNTIVMELALIAQSEYDPSAEVDSGDLPKVFKKVNMRKYSSVVLVELKFRGIPRRITQRGDWTFGGKTDIKFTSYALNDQELKVFKEQIGKSELSEIFETIQGATEESLKEMQKDIDEFTGKKEEEEKIKREQEAKEQDVNPFKALFEPLFKSDKKKKETEDLSKGIKPDNEYEKVARSQAILDAREKCFTIFDTYKKAHGMPSHASHFEAL